MKNLEIMKGKRLAEGHLLGEKATAVVVEVGDGVAEEVDGQDRRWKAVGGRVFEVLEDAEAVDTLGTGADEEVAALEVGTEGRPKVVGGELLTEEWGHGGLYVAVVEGWKEVVGGLDGGEALFGIEGITILHALDALGDGRAGTEWDARGDTPLWANYHALRTVGFDKLADKATCLGKFLQEVEILTPLQGSDAPYPPIRP